MLKAGERVDEITKVYWSRHQDRLLARLSIRKARQQPANLGRTARVLPNEIRIIPLTKLRELDGKFYVKYLTEVLEEEVRVYKRLRAKLVGTATASGAEQAPSRGNRTA